MELERVQPRDDPRQGHGATRGPLVVANRLPSAPSAEAAVSAVCQLLVSEAAVSEPGCGVATRREHHQPSGLPAHTPFALFSIGEPGALRSAVAAVVFETAIEFHRLDDPTVTLPLRLVIGVSDPERARQPLTISLLIDALARENRAETMLDLDIAGMTEELAAIVHGHQS